MSFKIDIEADLKELDEQIQKADRNIVQLGRKANATIRKGFNSLVIFEQLTGDAVSQSLQLLAQSAFISAETVLQIASAQALNPATVVQAGFGFLAASTLFAQAATLDQKAGEVDASLVGIISLANEWRY